MVFITMGIGAASTAHEGKGFGSRYHSLWTPLRAAFAMDLLVLVPGIGLSLIQGAVLLMVWFSIGSANCLATQATSYIVKQGVVISDITPNGGEKLAKKILQSEITDQYFVNCATTGSLGKVRLDANPVWTQPTLESGSYGLMTTRNNTPSCQKNLCLTKPFTSNLV